MSKVKIIGHRGAANHTENTIPAFESALAQKVDGIELDVRASSDGQLVVIHDSVVGEYAVKSTAYEAFKKLPNGYEAPLLEDVLKKFGKKTLLDIELKHDGIEEAAVALIKRYCNPEKTMISGFDAESLSKVHELLPELQLGYIYNRTQDEAARHNCPIDVVIPQFRLASRELIEEVHDEGLAVWAWTVNEEEEVRRLVNLGVDGLITDHPDKVRGWLA
jgi:glycerophosphoryl diester phosphodiesterase